MVANLDSKKEEIIEKIGLLEKTNIVSSDIVSAFKSKVETALENGGKDIKEIYNDFTSNDLVSSLLFLYFRESNLAVLGTNPEETPEEKKELTAGEHIFMIGKKIKEIIAH